MATSVRSARMVFGTALLAILIGCASTTVAIDPLPQAPICNSSNAALVLWSPQWRTDQKDVSAREDAAASGLREFLAKSGCFANTELRRVQSLVPAIVQAQLASAPPSSMQVVGVEVRELGPVVKLFSSAALVEGGTEVVLRIVEFSAISATEVRQFTVHWRSGGSGVVKGVASLPSDMQAALRAGLQPAASAR